MLIKTIPVGHLETNCYIVSDEKTLACAVIDPGDESNAILDYLEDNHLQCRAILLTHGHFDHTGAVYTVQEETGATVYMGAPDDQGLEANGYTRFAMPQNGKHCADGDVIAVDGLKFEVIATPGHTLGGISYRCGDALFVGDTLFRGSCGRTDLPGGDIGQEMRSLARLCALPGDYEVYPGHMDATTLERERRFNYYCREAAAKY